MRETRYTRFDQPTGAQPTNPYAGRCSSFDDGGGNMAESSARAYQITKAGRSPMPEELLTKSGGARATRQPVLVASGISMTYRYAGVMKNRPGRQRLFPETEIRAVSYHVLVLPETPAGCLFNLFVPNLALPRLLGACGKQKCCVAGIIGSKAPQLLSISESGSGIYTYLDAMKKWRKN